MTKQEFFIMMLRSAVTAEPINSFAMTPYEYKAIMEMAKKQAVEGLIIESMINNHVKLQKKCVISMMKMKNAIAAENRRLNKRAIEIGNIFEKAGFRYAIVKGQGNALLYPNQMSRVPGDIDIWVEGKRKEISHFVKSQFPDAEGGELHIDYPIFKDTTVEVHFKPCLLCSPFSDRKLQKWIRTNSETQFSNRVQLPEADGEVCISTIEFNVVQQMTHVMHHFFTEGIGLRQIVDYFYVLKNTKHNNNFEKIFKRTGMLTFARGMMWVENHLFGLDDTYLLVKPNEKVGKIIFLEIMEGGNFGRHDERYSKRKEGKFSRVSTDIKRLIKLIPTFPSEALWAIERKGVNQVWKL